MRKFLEFVIHEKRYLVYVQLPFQSSEVLCNYAKYKKTPYLYTDFKVLQSSEQPFMDSNKTTQSLV
jgi:hypothetical protein